MKLEIKGLQKMSLIDYPGKISCIVFLPGCNFRCGFCQNPDLILNPNLPIVEHSELFDFLEKRKKFLEGVVITGGEPCIHNELPEFISKIKKMGFLVKLDTNGSKPEILNKLIEKRLIDYIAMDIKAPIEKYDFVAGVKLNKEKIKKSIDLIKNSGIDYEFRTTCVPGLFDKKDALLIGKWLDGSKKFYLQNFRPLITLNRKYQNIKPFTKEELEEFARILKPFFEVCEIRD